MALERQCEKVASDMAKANLKATPLLPGSGPRRSIA
jgi:hypothetical protein